jgi:hypothetical protein
MTETPLDEALKNLRALKLKRDEAKATFESLDDNFKHEQFKLMERMRATGVESVRVDGTLFVPTETIYAQVQDRSELVEWAREHAPELIEDRERKELLNQEVRRRIDDGDAMPPGLGFYVREYISQRAA